STSRIEAFGNPQHERLLHHDVVGIAAIGHTAGMSLFTVVGADKTLFTVLLQAFGTGGATLAGIHHAADARHVARLELGHLRAHAYHAANDFMPGNHWKHRVMPLIPRGVQVRMTDAT